MKFQQGHKFAKGGKRPGAGRPSKAQLAERESLRAAIERKREELANAFSNAYLGMALSDPATMRHLVDKLIPDAKQERDEQQRPVQITFLQFTNNSTQLAAKEVAVAIEQTLPQENRLPEPQGQDGIKFLDFTKRRQ